MKELPILIVDTNRSNAQVLAEELLGAGYKTTIAASLNELDEILHNHFTFAMTVIDLSGFDDEIWKRCDNIRQNRIPCIIITPHRSPSIRREVINHRVDALLVQPVTVKEIIEHIRTTLGD